MPNPPAGVVRTSPFIAVTPDLRELFPAAPMTELRSLLRRREFSAAFRLAEKTIDPANFQVFMEVLLGADGPPFEAAELLTGLEEHSRAEPASPWPWLLRTMVLFRMVRGDEALWASGELLKRCGGHGWMRTLRGQVLLLFRADYACAEKEFRAALKAAPRMWRTKAFIAEASLCRGKTLEGLRIMDELVEGFTGFFQAEAAAWRGELRLWTGDAQGALADLDFAVGEGVKMGLCWRAAAQVALGNLPRALVDLDMGLRFVPDDREALVLRGELRLGGGRPELALEDFDAALAVDQLCFWALAGRARLRLMRGELEAAWQDARAMPEAVLAHFCAKAKTPLSHDPSPEALLRVLEAGLALRPEFRRSDRYLYPVWMKPAPRGTCRG